MPLSISSSKIDYRRVPDKPWRSLLLAACLLLLPAIGCWEYLSRSMHHTPGSYLGGFDAMWAEERRKLDEPEHDIRVVLAGSSRMLWNADLDILQNHLGTRPLQLALPGTSPALFIEDIVDNTNFDGLLLVGVTPFLFNWIGDGIFGRGALDRYHSESPSEWTGTQISHRLNQYFAFLDTGFSLFELTERYSGLPHREGATNLMEKEWKLGNIYADRQMDMWPPIEDPNSFDHQQILNFWRPTINMAEPETPEQLAAMAEGAITFFLPLIKKFRARGGEMVFIRMPSDGLYLEHDLVTDHRQNLWQPMVDGFDAPMINCMDYPQLSSELEIPEWSHLSRASQDLWSARIIPYVDQALRANQAKSISQVTGIELD